MLNRQLVQEVLGVMRKKRKRVESPPADTNTLAELLDALRVAGYVVIPRGLLDNLRRCHNALQKYGEGG